MEKMPFTEKCPTENGIFALFSPKIRTWSNMPLKVGFIQPFIGLVTDLSTSNSYCHDKFKDYSVNSRDSLLDC
jgi:hypothetical protein